MVFIERLIAVRLTQYLDWRIALKEKFFIHFQSIPELVLGHPQQMARHGEKDEDQFHTY